MKLKRENIVAECFAVLAKKEKLILEAMQSSREAANNETKSSAGDKYETTRAMMHAEQDRLAQQLAALRQMKQQVFNAQKKPNNQKVAFGSIVLGKNVQVFLSAGLGKIEVDGEQVFAISTASPLGKMLMNKAVDDTFVWQRKSEKILQLL